MLYSYLAGKRAVRSRNYRLFLHSHPCQPSSFALGRTPSNVQQACYAVGWRSSEQEHVCRRIRGPTEILNPEVSHDRRTKQDKHCPRIPSILELFPRFAPSSKSQETETQSHGSSRYQSASTRHPFTIHRQGPV